MPNGLGIDTRTPARISATGAVKNGPGSTTGFIASSSSSGTMTLYDNTSATGTPFINAMPIVAGQWYLIPTKFSKGLWAVIGGTADVTFFI